MFKIGGVVIMFLTIIIGGIIYFVYKTWEQRKARQTLKVVEPKHFDEAASIRALKFRYENHKIKGGHYEKGKSASTLSYIKR